LGVPKYLDMFVRPKKNASGSVSIQIISKARGRYKVVKTLGSATTRQEIERLTKLAQQEIKQLCKPLSLFSTPNDVLVENVFQTLHNSSIQTVGPELVFGKIFDSIGFNQVGEELFRHLVISRLAFPLSKLKTIEYLQRYRGVSLDIDAVYRFLDKLNSRLKEQVEQIAFNHTMKVLDGNISVVFYDMTTLYFEASDEDDLRKTGFSKDGRHQNPQIFIGLLVGLGGYAIGYDIFEGNSYEGHTLIPFLEKMEQKFKLGKLVVIADSGLLSNDNIAALEFNGYEYILGARLKNETVRIKTEILQHTFSDGDTISISKTESTRLIVNYSTARASKDEYNRKRGLTRLEKQVRAGKLTKSNINNRGYNKYLKLTGEISIEIDYQKYYQDNEWDGLKGYLTNTRLSDAEVLENYKNLWHIEKAFRMSKTDLRIRPVYHRLRDRIEAHIGIAFIAYCVYKELERILYQEKSTLSLKKAAELTHNMYRITYTLPDSKHSKTRLLTMDAEQQELYDIISRNF
jgi:transposase